MVFQVIAKELLKRNAPKALIKSGRPIERNQLKAQRYFSNLIEEKTKLYNEGKIYKNYLNSDLKPYSSAKELAKDEILLTHAKESYPDLIKILPDSYSVSSLQTLTSRAKKEVVGTVRDKPLSYLSGKKRKMQEGKKVLVGYNEPLPGGTVSFRDEQKRRLAFKNLEDFLRSDEKNLRYNSMELADMELFKDVNPIGRGGVFAKRHAGEVIRNFRKLKGLEKTTDPSKLNPFGLTIGKAGQFHKTDPQLQGLFNLGKEKVPRGMEGKLTGILSPMKKRKDWKTGEWTDQTASEYYKGMLDRNIAGSKRISRLHDVGFKHNPGKPPEALSTQQRNNVHRWADNRLRFLDDMIERNPGSIKKIKEWKKEMKEIGEDMELLGLQADIKGVTYGKWYAKPGDSIYRQVSPFFKSLKKEHPLKRLKMKGPSGKLENYKYKGYDEGGMVEGYAAGGIIKSLLPKMSRRKFLKGAAATAASVALPRSALKSTVPTVKSLMERRLSFAPPWVAKMTSALNLAVNKKGVTKLPNGTTVEYIKGPHTKYDSHKLAVKTADGNEDLVNFKETKDSLEIEFDIRDEWHNNQHIYIDKKKKTAELIDENYYMTSPEDYAKDDPIIWDIDKKSLDKTIVLDKTTKADDYIYDYMSTPNDSDYSYLFERYIDSFSPAGNIFKTKEYAKNLRKQQALEKKAQEDRSMTEWEEQFRGGHGMHGYYRGGMTMDDYKDMPKRDANKIQPKQKPDLRFRRISGMSDQEAMARMMMAEDAGSFEGGKAVGHVIYNRAQNPNRYMPNRAKGISPIISVLSSPTGFSPYIKPTSRFFVDYTGNTTYDDYYRYAGEILAGQAKDFTGGADFFATPERISQYRKDELMNLGDLGEGGQEIYFGLSQQPKYLADYGGHKFYKSYNKGGFVEEGIDLIKANPQRFVAGGLVKKYAPNVLGKLTNYKPKLTGKGPDLSGVRADLYTPPKGPYTITDESGVRTIDMEYKTLSEAQAALKALSELRTQDASTFKIFGKRPPKTAEGAWESAPEVNLGMVGKELPPEKPGAMFWGSREKIIGAPSEAMSGKEWLRYLQLPKHGILNPKGYPIIRHGELNDTGLAPYLSQNPNKMISKEQLVKDFDTKLAPEIEVVALGREGAGREVDELFQKMNKMDMQAYREGPIKNVLMGVRNRVHPLREAVGNNNKDAVMEIVDAIDNLTFDNFGVANAIKEGFPQKFPYELKNILQRIAQISGVRTAGFKKYTKDVQYRGQQTLGGGENYREFLFKYKHPSGSLRETEPMQQYSNLGADHFSSLSSKDQTGGFVHTRVSDRTDEFGRRILHIEEIQSDLHQPVNAAARRVRRAEAEGKRPSASDIKKSKYAPRGDLAAEPIDKANEQQLGLILSKIEDLAAQPQTKNTQIRLNRLNKERAKIRKIIADKRAKMAEGDHSGIAMGPLSKTEDYNEFVMKYMTKVAQEGGYDGVTISSGAIKNRGEQAGSLDWKGNMVAYGPIAEGAMKKVAKKTGAKYLKTSIIDDKGRGWEVPMIWLDNTAVKLSVQKGMPIYRKGGMVING